jgi:hypothetical protein
VRWATIDAGAGGDGVDEFEYITVLLSIILGLGVTQLLSGIARLLRDGRSLARAWWVLAVVATLLLSSLQVWWISFIWRDVQEWTFFSYLAFMVLPILLYLLAYLVLPADLHLDGDALAQAFIERRRPFYAIVALIPLASFAQQRLLSGSPPQADLDTALRLVWIVLAVPGFLSRRVAVQACVATLALTLMLVYISTLFTHLQ